jgi:preprotein translocase subunit Sec63
MILFKTGKNANKDINEIETPQLVWYLENIEQLDDYKKLVIKQEILSRLEITSQTLTKQYIHKIYKKMCLKYHPDKGGSNKEMQSINEFYTQLNKEI